MNNFQIGSKQLHAAPNWLLGAPIPRILKYYQFKDDMGFKFSTTHNEANKQLDWLIDNEVKLDQEAFSKLLKSADKTPVTTRPDIKKDLHSLVVKDGLTNESDGKAVSRFIAAGANTIETLQREAARKAYEAHVKQLQQTENKKQGIFTAIAPNKSSSVLPQSQGLEPINQDLFDLQSETHQRGIAEVMKQIQDYWKNQPSKLTNTPFNGFVHGPKTEKEGEWVDVSKLPSFLGSTPEERLEKFKKYKQQGIEVLKSELTPERAKELSNENRVTPQSNVQDKARGLRYNSGKTLYNLLPPYAMEQIAKVFTKGALKYAPNNWRKGMPWSEVEGSLMRHFEAYRSGEDFDEESGLYHMAHVAVNALFLIEYYRCAPKFDDRYKSYLQKPKVVLDIDEVVCGWAQGYKNRTGKDIQAEYWDSRYGFPKELAELAKDKEFWVTLPCIRKPDFVPHAYVSSRSIPVEWTQEWLERNGLPCRPVHHVPFDHSKVEVLKSLNTDYFVDDRFENFYEAETNGICSFLMDASHNQHHNVGYKRIKSLRLKDIIR